MLVPKAPMHKNRDAPRAKHYIGPPWQILDVEAVTQTSRVQRPPNL
jgi:hypothetical protein